MTNFLDALKKNSKLPVIIEPEPPDLEWEAVINSLRKLNKSSFEDIKLNEVDQVYLHFASEYRKGLLTVNQIYDACNALLCVSKNLGDILNRTKYGDSILWIADAINEDTRKEYIDSCIAELDI